MIPIAYFIHDLRIGGAERHLLQVFKKLDRLRFRPILFCLGEGGHRMLYEQVLSLGVETVNIGYPNHWASPQTLIKTLQTAALLRRRKVHIVHGYLFEGSLFGALAGRLAGIPIIIASKRSFDRYSRPEKLACRLATGLATRVTANSRSVEEFVQRQEPASRRKIVVIPNGIDIPPIGNGSSPDRAQWNIPPGVPVVGTVARFSWKKNYPCFLRMAAKVSQINPEAWFIAIGDGPLLPRMRRRAVELGLESRMIFTGWQKEPERLLPLFDIYVCSSLIEGMSNAMLEAMAQSLPVVATDVGGNREVVSQGKTGSLVASDDPDALAAAVLSLIENPERRIGMGKAGRRKASDQFSSQEMVHKLEHLYEELLLKYGIDASHPPRITR